MAIIIASAAACRGHIYVTGTKQYVARSRCMSTKCQTSIIHVVSIKERPTRLDLSRRTRRVFGKNNKSCRNMNLQIIAVFIVTCHLAKG